MIMNVTVTLNLKTKEVAEVMAKAARLAMKDTVIDVANEVMNVHPWKNRTGNKMRSIKYEVSGFGSGEGIVDQSKIEGAVYSTSGYGGFLETGTVRMPAVPYFKPAGDKKVPQFPERLKEHLP